MGLFQYFFDYFKKVLSNSNANHQEMQLAVHGFGEFSKAFLLHMSPEEIQPAIISMTQKIEVDYVLNPNPTNLELLPEYVYTLACILESLPEIHYAQIVSLERITVLMVRMYPKLSYGHQKMVSESFVFTMYCLSNHRYNILTRFLGEVVYQCVIRTCSHFLALDADKLKDEGHEVICYKDFWPFWKHLLKLTEKYNKFEIKPATRKYLLDKLFVHLLGSLFSAIDKLNLNIKATENITATDPEMAFKAVKVNDYNIFINIIEFYQDVLQAVEPEMFKSWIPKYLKVVILKSVEHPLISGFYKLLSSGLKLCDDLDYFQSNSQEVVGIKESLCTFLGEMIWRMKHYKGDLQIACLSVILSTPVVVIKYVLPVAAPTFVTLFTVGRSYLTLTQMGIATLQKWVKALNPEDLEPFLKHVLPCLDSYLRSRSLGSTIDTTSSVVKRKKTKTALSKRRVLIESESELFKVQKQILEFLGQLDSNTCAAFAASQNNVEQVVWSSTPHLKIVLPFEDVKLNIYLEKLVPRIVELAMYSSDRKLRVTACELLHAVVIVILGTSKFIV